MIRWVLSIMFAPFDGWWDMALLAILIAAAVFWCEWGVNEIAERLVAG